MERLASLPHALSAPPLPRPGRRQPWVFAPDETAATAAGLRPSSIRTNPWCSRRQVGLVFPARTRKNATHARAQTDAWLRASSPSSASSGYASQASSVHSPAGDDWAAAADKAVQCDSAELDAALLAARLDTLRRQTPHLARAAQLARLDLLERQRRRAVAHEARLLLPTRLRTSRFQMAL